MAPEQKVAYLNAQVACALCELEGMKAENAARAINGEHPAYNVYDFERLIQKYGIHHNAVIGWLSD